RRTVSGAGAPRLAILRRVVPPLAAILVLAGGVVLLLSANLPASGTRMDWLEDVVPLPFIEASHLLSSLTGLLLIVIARGLYRRLATARLAAIALLLLGAGFSLAKGLDWEEALLLSAIAAGLTVAGPAFYRKGDWRFFRPDRTWIGLIVIVVAACTLIGLLAYRHVDYRADLWWEFAWKGDAPRFLRATLALSVLAAALAIDTLVNRPVMRPADPPIPVPPAVRRILAGSSDTQACVALLGDKRFLVAEDGKAFLMYAERGSSWITMGDPVGEAQSAPVLIWRFAEAADRAGARAVFYAVQPAFLPFYLDMGLAILKIGEVARVPLADFTLTLPARKPLRYARGKAGREGIAFSVVPKAEVPAILPELRAVSDAWLTSKSGREKGFSLGRFDEAYIAEFDCAVMRRGERILAFANLWRSGDGGELSIDLMRHLPEAPNIVMDALFAHLLLYGQAQGYRWFNLGAAPLAGLTDHPLASTWNRVGTFIYRRGDEFYNFEGLRAFKQKFDPVWTPQYLACRGGLTLPQALFDVT
ncbi:bifunctional lysylphosphatidylglycerol flippase/synthetase MprF, partial [Paracoccus sp. (in: a-proteobacteria)]|uniref:bifunctional lysylphosphatidylglycerol flippase/synthetase MprF n=1 Tax=Paracoccus sp. TaxID=267 RepID=UPI0026E0F105